MSSSPGSYPATHHVTLDDESHNAEAGPSVPRPRTPPRRLGPALESTTKGRARAISVDEAGGDLGLTPITHLSPILAAAMPSQTLSPSKPPPQYAEDFTPLKLRRQKHPPVSQPATGTLGHHHAIGSFAEGYYTPEGDLYRGAMFNPIIPVQAIEEDAITLGSTTSSSSNWSWASGLSAGRRAKAVIERVGEAFRVRRGSGSSTDSDTQSQISGGVAMQRSKTMTRSKSRSRRLSRTTTVQSDDARPKRLHVPRRREFVLLLPPEQAAMGGMDLSISRVATPAASISDTGQDTPSYPPDRVITTPSLPVVLDHIRSLRAQAGIAPIPDEPSTRPTRGGSWPGKSRRPKMRQTASFANPPVPQHRSRLQALRESSALNVPRPKSVSDIMGLAGLGGSSSSLNAMNKDSPSSSPPLSRETRGGVDKGKERGCWWLDVACPEWEDLRDLGEVSLVDSSGRAKLTNPAPRTPSTDTGGHTAAGSAGKARVSRLVIDASANQLSAFDSLNYYLLVVRALDEGYFKYTPGSSSALVGPGEVAEPDFQLKTDAKRRSHAEEKHHEAQQKEKEGRSRGWGMGRTIGRGAKSSGEKVEIVEDRPGKEGLEGVGVGAINVYLVVFGDGLVSVSRDRRGALLIFAVPFR